MIKRRNLLLMVLLMLVTLGIYGIYWYYQTSEELIRATGDKSSNPLIWTLLLFIPPIHVLSFWFYAQAFGRFSNEKTPTWLIFLLFAFLPFIAWIPVQLELNEAAGNSAIVPPAVPA
jgi:magnesium-transporting ATPase (P-type)